MNLLIASINKYFNLVYLNKILLTNDEARFMGKTVLSIEGLSLEENINHP